MACGLFGADGQQQQWDEQVTDRRLVLLKFVQEVEPAVMEAFEAQAPPPVLAAVHATVANMLGTLPPQFFAVTVSASGENMAQLMYSVLMTGYMFRNAWYRQELAMALAAAEGGGAEGGAQAQLVGAGSLDSADDDGGRAAPPPAPAAYAPGSQKLRVEGEVLRWHHDNGAERIPALAYIEGLEAELEELRRARGAACVLR